MKKELKTWLVVDTRTGKFKLLSSKISLQSLKSKIKGTEVPISLTLNVEVPETPIVNYPTLTDGASDFIDTSCLSE